MRETVPVNGLRPQGYRYVLPNLGRWAFMLIAFIYLLALALALFEAVTLQSFVKSQAADGARARAAMLKLHEHRDWQQPDADPRYPAMMVSLDKLKAATRSLGLLRGTFTFPDSSAAATEDFQQSVAQLDFALNDLNSAVEKAAPDLGIARSLSELNLLVGGLGGYAEPAQSQGALSSLAAGNQADKTSGASETQTLKKRLGELLGELDGLLKRIETSPSAELVRQELEGLNQKVSEFANSVAKKRMRRRNAIKLKNENAGEASQEARAVSPQKKDTADRITAGDPGVAQSVAARVGEESGSKSVEAPAIDEAEAQRPQGDCGSLQLRPAGDATAEILAGDTSVWRCTLKLGEEIEIALPADAFVHENDLPLAYTAHLRNQGENKDKRALLPEWLLFDGETFCGNPNDEAHVGDYTIGVRATDKYGDFSEGVFQISIDEGTASDKRQWADGACEQLPLPDYEVHLAQLAERLIEFEQALQNSNADFLLTNTDFSVVRRLSTQIVRIDEAAALLGRLSPGGDLRYENPSDAKTGSEARSLFDQQRELLGQTAERLENILGAFSPVMAVGLTLGDDPQAYAKASVIWDEFAALQRFEPILMPLRSLEGYVWEEPFDSFGLPGSLADFGLRPQKLATLGNEVLTLTLVLVIGALGSLIFMTKRQLGGALQGIGLRHKPDIGFAWYLFRPIFGVVVAFAIYLLYKAGQIALGGSGADAAFAGINVPILSVIALFAGLLSWQALDMIEGRGRAWLGSVERRDLWATGLDNALRSLGRSLRECADQVGRSVGQVERWIGCRDKVTPEMQDRIITWTGRKAAELFSDKRPEDALAVRPMWARGLERVLTSNGRALDAKALAEILGEDPERVEAWIKCDRQVSPAMQWRIVEVLDVRHSEVFEQDDRAVDRWAVGLRRALEKSGLSGAKELAARIGADVARVRAWMELQERVPLEMQVPTARVLSVGERQLFADDKPPDRQFMWATQLRDRMADGVKEDKTVEALADSVDVDPDQVRAWRDLDVERGRVAPATQDRIAEVLGERKSAIFSQTRDGEPLRWGTGIRAALKNKRWTAAKLAEELDSDPKLVERWVALKEEVPPAAQRAIAGALSAKQSDLFRDKEPS